MKLEKYAYQDRRAALLADESPALQTADDVLELIAGVRGDIGADRLLVNKAALPAAFFDLRSGFAGEMLQKLVNYQIRTAIYGDFTQYVGKALHDFIYECNRGRHIHFTGDRQSALDWLFSL